MPPRKRPTFAKRHRVTLELRCVLANMEARRLMPVDDPELSAAAVRELWEEYWGGAAEGGAAFEALRHDPALHLREGASYERWLGWFVERDPRFAEADDADDEPDPDEDGAL